MKNSSTGRVRGTGLGGGHDEREQTLNQILNEMDGFSPHESVVVVAATNRPDVLDPGLTRPGRFDRQITLQLPAREARRQIMVIHAKEVPLAHDVDLDDIAGATVGFSGADLKNLVNEAAILASRKDKQAAERVDFDEALDKIRLGPKRELLMDEEIRDLIVELERKAETILQENRTILDALADALVAQESLDADAVDRILGGTSRAVHPRRSPHHYKHKGIGEGRKPELAGGRLVRSTRGESPCPRPCARELSGSS